MSSSESMTTSREEFEHKIIELGKSLYTSHFYLKIHEWMTDESNKRLSEYPPFFAWSRMALYEAGVLRLARAYEYDKRGENLGLLKILNIIESSYSSWKCSETLDNKILQQDKELVSYETNSLVKKLKHQRDKTIAHTDHRLFPSIISSELDKVYGKYGDELIYKQGRLTTEEIEKQPLEMRDIILHQMHEEIFQVIDDQENKFPTFCELYQLTNQGIEICNRYMQKLSIPPIELKLEGIEF